MEAVIGQALVLIGINVVLFLVIGMVILDNPLKLGIMIAVAVANCVMFFGVALFSADSPRDAFFSFGTKMLPWLVVIFGLALLILVQLPGRELKRRKVPRSSTRFIR